MVTDAFVSSQWCNNFSPKPGCTGLDVQAMTCIRHLRKQAGIISQSVWCNYLCFVTNTNEIPLLCYLWLSKFLFLSSECSLHLILWLNKLNRSIFRRHSSPLHTETKYTVLSLNGSQVKNIPYTPWDQDRMFYNVYWHCHLWLAQMVPERRLIFRKYCQFDCTDTIGWEYKKLVFKNWI